jgi:hypothetical protein
MNQPLEAIRNLGIAARLGLLAATVAVLLLAVGGAAWAFQGPTGAIAATFAAAVCLAGAGLALGASRLLAHPSQAVANVLAGMMLRMGMPLGIALAVHLHGGPLARGGLLYYLLVFYPVTLGIETALSLPQCGSAAGRKREISDPTP